MRTDSITITILISLHYGQVVWWHKFLAACLPLTNQWFTAMLIWITKNWWLENNLWIVHMGVGFFADYTDLWHRFPVGPTRWTRVWDWFLFLLFSYWCFSVTKPMAIVFFLFFLRFQKLLFLEVFCWVS